MLTAQTTPGEVLRCGLRRFAALPCALLGALLLLPAAARAASPQPPPDQDLKSLSLEQLGNVEVTTASKEPEEVWRTPAAIFVLTQDDIRRSGVTSIPDALRLVPGVEVARVDGDNWVVGIRGFGDLFSKSVLVLIDGRNVYTPLFSGVYWTIDNVMMEDIDRIEVIRGPGGTIWGPNAENGIINIITKRSEDTKGALVAAGGGDVDQGTGDFRYGSSNGKNLSYRAYGMVFSRSAEHHVDGINSDDSRLGQVGFRADWKKGRDTVTLQGDAYKGQLGNVFAVSSYTPPGRTISYDPYSLTGGNVLGRWRRDLGAHGDLYAQGYWMRDYRIGSNFGETRDTFDFDFLHHLPAGKRNELTYGVEARISPATIRQVNQTLDFQPHHLTWNVYSGFVQDVLTLAPGKLSFTIGSKLASDSYSGFQYQPSGRLLWTPTPTRSVWAAVTRAVRTPGLFDANLIDDSYLAPGLFLRLAGNSDIRAEKVVSYEEGLRTLTARNLYIDIAGYHSQYDDIVGLGDPTVTKPTSPGGPHTLVTYQFANSIHGTSDGFELAPDWKPTQNWQLKGSYSYLHLDLSNKPFVKNQIILNNYRGNSPSHEVVLQSNIDLPKRFELDETFRYESHRPAQNVRAYSTADARLGWHLSKQFEVSVTGENLFQPHHAEFGAAVGPNVLIKRSVYAKIVWTR